MKSYRERSRTRFRYRPLCVRIVFLTLEDPRARVKGSRDPLGVQPIWSAFGRRIVANLTTVTNSLRGFTVLLLGRYLGELLLREGRIEEEDVVDVFLRVEQVCGYARYFAIANELGRAGRILGIERVKRRISEGAASVSIGVAPGATILSDQKTYGLWGLFSVSARVSKLLPDGPVGLSREARDFVQSHYLQDRSQLLVDLQRLARGEGKLRLDPSHRVLSALGAILGERPSAVEQQFYREYLCDGEHCGHLPNGRQARFRRLLESHSELRQSISRDELLSIKNASRAIDPRLAKRIGHILALEALLAPCDVIFGFLRTRHGQLPSKVALKLGERWGRGVPNLDPEEFAGIRGEIAAVVGEEITEQMAGVQTALSCGQYQKAITHLLAWNRLVMMHRSAAPWVRLNDCGALDVRYPGIERELPTGSAMSSLWRNSYFIDALKDLVDQTALTPSNLAP